MSVFQQMTEDYLANKYPNHALFCDRSRREIANSVAIFLQTLQPEGIMTLMAGVLAGVTDLNELARRLTILYNRRDARWTATHVECVYLRTICGLEIPEFQQEYMDSKTREDGGDPNAWARFDFFMRNAYKFLHTSPLPPVVPFLHDLEAVEFLQNLRFQAAGRLEDIDEDYEASGHVRKARRLR